MALPYEQVPVTPNDEPETKSDRYRRAVSDQWMDAKTIHAWTKWHASMARQLSQITQALLRRAEPLAGARVIDLGSGTGEPALSIAARVGSLGRVVATDLVEEMLVSAARNAQEAGLSNVDFGLADAHSLPFPGETFDLAVSRLSAMYFVEIQQALAEVRRVLKPGGRLAFLVWGMPDQGDYFATCVLPFLMRSDIGAPPPTAPSPVRFSPPGALLAEVGKAGFTDVREERELVELRWPGPPEELWQHFYETSVAIRPIYDGLPRNEFKDAYNEAISALQRHYDGVETINTAEVAIVTAIKPV